jgi:hypothetical protein
LLAFAESHAIVARSFPVLVYASDIIVDTSLLPLRQFLGALELFTLDEE